MIKNNVLIGKDNWLFLYNGGQKQFDYLLGIEKVNSVSVDNFYYNIKKRLEFCQVRNIEYCHIVFPSKPVIKKKFLPDEKGNIKSLFQNYYASTASSSCILYPFKELINLEEEYSSFHKFNTHNSDHGYLEIVKAIFKKLNCEVSFEEFIQGIESKMVGGDLAKMASLNTLNEEYFINLKQHSKVFRVGNREFLPGNKNDVVILHNTNSISQKRLLAFGDSFLKGTLKFLRIYFKEIFYVRSAFFHKDIVEAYSPDVLFTSNAERYLCSVESDELANNFIMDLYGNKNYRPSKKYLEAFQACLSYKYYHDIYAEWISEIHKSIELEPFTNLNTMIKPGSNASDILRQVAIAFDCYGDTVTSSKIMKEALRLGTYKYICH